MSSGPNKQSGEGKQGPSLPNFSAHSPRLRAARGQTQLNQPALNLTWPATSHERMRRAAALVSGPKLRPPSGPTQRAPIICGPPAAICLAGPHASRPLLRLPLRQPLARQPRARATPTARSPPEEARQPEERRALGLPLLVWSWPARSSSAC